MFTNMNIQTPFRTWVLTDEGAMIWMEIQRRIIELEKANHALTQYVLQQTSKIALLERKETA